MANSINNVQVSLHNHTYDRLLQLKQKKGCTFDELVNELIEYALPIHSPQLEYNSIIPVYSLNLKVRSQFIVPLKL